jgi:hypothetical protein
MLVAISMFKGAGGIKLLTDVLTPVLAPFIFRLIYFRSHSCGH